ncbi:MAG: dihydropteroate synthase [Proteobacteria bacterium]|nr:dihydropteroate synthase [Pseudomonadota bacterium]
MSTWSTTRFEIDLARPRVMGIVNATPDSFSDGGRYRPEAHCDQLVAEGADILDIGGESTRPGAQPPPLHKELARVLPVVRHAVTLGLPVSVDTSRPEVMQAALDLGADIVNDVRALTLPGALDVVAGHGRCGVCLMHMQGQPATMQLDPHYTDVVAEVRDFLATRVQALVAQGVTRNRIALDPGYGFGKTLDHHLTLFAHQQALLTLGQPLLVGWSRKGMLGQLTGRPPGQRLVASVAAALAAVQRGARIVRVHDVAETVDALTIWAAAGLGNPTGEDNR